MWKFIHRIIGATVLDAATYEEVEADKSSTGQALVVVLLSAAAAGVGARGYGAPATQIPMMAILALLAWAAWALLTYEIGVRIMPDVQTRADVTELMRTMGFASAPGMLRVIGVAPAFTTPVFALTAVWMLLAMVVAVRQALDYTTTTRALAVCGLGWALTLAFVLTLGLVVI